MTVTLRRLALALALLSAPVDADDFDDLSRTAAHPTAFELSLTDRASSGRGLLEDLLLRPDGSIAAAVGNGFESKSQIPWSLVRLVLADVGEDGEENEEPVWIETMPARRVDTGENQVGERPADGVTFLALNNLTGAAVVGPNGEAIGVVRGALVSWETGHVLALALDVGGYLDTESRTIALPWSWLRIPDEASAGAPITSGADSHWIRSAPDVVLTHLLR